MKMFRKLVTLVLGISSLGVLAQTPSAHTYPALDTNNVFTGPNNFAKINGKFVAGVANYTTVQLTLNAACAAGQAAVVLPPGFSTSEVLTALTGCSSVYISDERSATITNYQWNGTAYVPVGSSGGSVTLTGDATGTGAGTVPTLLAISTLTGNYTFGSQVAHLTRGVIDSVGAPFSMSMTCVAGGVIIGSGNFEIGYSTTSPNVCTLSYSNGTAVSASVSDGINSYTDTTPYTVFTGAYSYTANTTLSASATSTTSQTATATKVFTVSPCTFSGLTTNAAPTGATASGSGSGNQCASETSMLTGGGTLTSNGLGATYIGQVFTFSSPGGEYPTLLLTETSSGCNRNPFTFNGSSPVNGTTQAITNYPNILGGVQSHMCLYTFGPYNSAVTFTVAH